jgi:hypothetical protein
LSKSALARPAADVQDVIRWRKPHLFQHRQGDGQVVLLHPLAPPRLRPAVKFLSKQFVVAGLHHGKQI